MAAAADSLARWFQQNGVTLHASLRIEQDSEGGLGLFAHEAVAQDAQLLSIPHSACISASSAQASLPFPLDVAASQLPIVYLFLTAAGHLTQHREYVAAIPRTILTPLHFSSLEVALLEGTPLHAATLQRLSSAAAEYAAISPSLPSAPEGLELYRWAVSAYNSRAFPPSLLSLPADSPAVMVPGLDLLNHARARPVTWAPTSTHVHFTAHYPLSPGEQAFNNYGPKSNEELLGSYGFVLQDPVDDFVTLKLPGGKMHFWKNEAPQELMQEIAEKIRREGEQASELEEQAEVLETLEVMLVQKRKAFKLAQARVAAVLAEQGDLQKGLEKGEHIREKVWKMIEIYRNGQAKILNQAIQWTRNELEQVADQLDLLESDSHSD